jgi:type II secretory pathway predicted ATPase ExeA
MIWLRHWDLQFDPFRPGAVPFVPIQGHEEAVARLVHLVEHGERRGEIRGVAELGKSVILHEALRRLRRPGRRLCLVRRPFDEGGMIRGLSLGFGRRFDPGVSISEALGHLLDCLRLDHAQGMGTVLAIDGDDLMAWESDRKVLDRLEALGHQSGGAVTVLITGRSESVEPSRWPLRSRLDRLTRNTTESYLSAKLQAAGRFSPVFSERAILRLHAVAEGLPGVIDRLASLALKAGALDQRTLISTNLISGIAQESGGMIDPITAPN